MTKCIGCGSVMQNLDKNKEGYTSNLENKLCERCFRIRHYNDYKFVNKDNKYYLKIIKDIEKTNDLVVLVTDFLNFDYSLKIKNPILFVLTKRDLIPRGVDEEKLLSKIKANFVDKVVIGPTNNYNLDLLFSKINKYKKSKDTLLVLLMLVKVL